MNYVTYTRNLENVPGKSGVGQGKSGNFFFQSLWEPCYMPDMQTSFFKQALTDIIMRLSFLICITCITYILFPFVYTELDEEECERRRGECLDDMTDLERQFSTLKDQ